MYENNIKKFLITIFKTVTYLTILFTFIFVMKRVNYALWEPTRTLAATAGAFIVVFIMMQHIYGNFEIGKKKSKPVFLSTMISVLFADFVAILAMIMMGLVQFPISKIVVPSILFGLLSYILQAMVVWISAHIGNDLYFRFFEPDKIAIINQDQFLYDKIYPFLKNHDKQYKIDKILYNIEINKLSDVDSIFALGLTPWEEQVLIEHCYKNNIKLTYNASQHNFLLAKQYTTVIDDALLIEIAPLSPSLFQLFIKRVMDIVGGLILFIISIPIYIIVGVAIKKEDKGPILFVQDRVTKNGKVFKIYKFRSMIVDASNNSATLEDDRITRVGEIIRKLRIDELPQAINILKGDISLVGPRPESLSNVEMYTSELKDFDLRHKVKAGLTGYAQIFGKYNTTPEMKLLLDLKYIEDFSIIEDIKLIFQTLIIFIKPDSTEGFTK